jgi:hypothetical protein
MQSNDRGPGLSPGPTPRQRLQILTLNINKLTYILSHNQWSVGRTVFAKALCGGEVWGSNPTDSNIILHNNKKPIKGCHVAAHDWATWHLTINQRDATCRSLIRPTVNQQMLATSPHVRSYGSATSACTDCTESVIIIFFCLFDFMNRLQYLSLPTSV